MKIKETLIAAIICLLLSWQLNAYPQSIKESCPISRNIDSEQICLPTLSGMTECIKETDVMSYFNNRTLPGNNNIAFYVNDENKEAIFDLSKNFVDNYLIVYTTMKLINHI